ncbi:MBL fold metallo-hydrolase [Luteimonas sp. MC1825]|uniref:ComEC/Rec2 family competence protein n=1 Tax=Luteimonas sp. MC1825 TaxID=2761107 RepID=UPI00160EF6B6|nr:MBL fold metallo-hydrolase [Luteimonas sp. MC1825]MBB6600330.1 hypothetical protein [Luteimonas sp. MC1825]QOC88008.1 hypothetical protein IDM46_12435 [Luteimonas sp. MC1825]
MADIFRILVFPAQRGDALLVEYGDEDAPYRILIDGGIKGTARDFLTSWLEKLGDDVRIDVLVVTHIDLDHIQGVLALVQALPQNITIGRVLFNGEQHLPVEVYGVAEALQLADELTARHADAWELGMAGRAVCLDSDEEPYDIDLPGEMTAKILSPSIEKMTALAEDWKGALESLGATDEQLEKIADQEDEEDLDGFERLGAEELDVEALAATKFTEDDAAPNGASIAFVLEYQGKRALMLGDAHPSLVLQSLKKVCNDPLYLDCVKLSHHGSRRNTNIELVEHLVSSRWIVSSNGASTRHPNLESIARLLRHSPGPKKWIYFNYRTIHNKMWDALDLKTQYQYETFYGDGQEPVIVDLL